MKRISICIIVVLIMFSCKGISSPDTGSFAIKNNSDSIIQFVWLTPKGEFYPTAREIAVQKDGVYEVGNLKAGVYDVAIDFKGQFNTFNSKKDSSKCLTIESGITSIWIVDESGDIIR